VKITSLILTALLASAFASGCGGAKRPAAMPGAVPTPSAQPSAPISNVRYGVRFDSTTAARRMIAVEMSFTAASAGPVLLSLPAWTPGSYEIANFARFVNDFRAQRGEQQLGWDKADHDTWRVVVPSEGQVTVAFNYTADSLDNAHSWSRPDFAFFNGTNLFLYPDEHFGFASTVTVVTQPDWRVATGMKPQQTGSRPGWHTYSAADYHELVDMPFFVGRFDIDSTTIVGKTFRFASYPSGTITAATRANVFQQMSGVVPAQAAIFGEVPWDTYTLLQVADEGFALGAAAGLEHRNSHLDIISPVLIGNPILPSLYSHEVFHVWNVKNMRPAEMVPYRYDRPQPTALLWIAEGVTDYYADLSQVRGKTITPRTFYSTTVTKIEAIEANPAVALEDASLATWIKPVDGTATIYYEKGSVAGLLLDILIRDATDNRGSLDTVMRDLYETTFKRDRGFTNTDWWTAVSRAAGGRSFREFEQRYIDGRDPFPYDSILPLAGLRLITDRKTQPSLGISASPDEDGLRVMQVVVSGPGATAGVQLGDYLISVGGLDASDPLFQEQFNEKFAATPPGGAIPIEIRRGTQRLTLNAPVRFNTIETRRIIEMANASPKALRVRAGLLSGTSQP
jgi:predicted metalloprotease with PDZ domain